jgi:hypothetical protein
LDPTDNEGAFRWVGFRLVVPSIIPGRDEQLAHWGITRDELKIRVPNSSYEEALAYTIAPTDDWENYFE